VESVAGIDDPGPTRHQLCGGKVRKKKAKSWQPPFQEVVSTRSNGYRGPGSGSGLARFFARSGTSNSIKFETPIRKGSLITYESIGFYHSSGYSNIWFYFLARRELRQDLG
jgi:hypothetical protein